MDIRKTKGSTLIAAGLMLTVTACGPGNSTGGSVLSGTEAAASATTASTSAESDSKADGAWESVGETQKAQEGQKETGVAISVLNDTVELGTLAVFEPSDNIEGNSGVAIAGSDEEQLQQERIAGGAVGEVVSKNLEPLHGITDYSEGEYVAVYGVTGE